MSKLFVDEIQPKTTAGIINAKGMITQVVNSVINSGSSNSQVTVRTAYLTVTITPQSTLSKIYVGAQGAGSVICGSSGILQSEIFRGDISSGTAISVTYQGLGAGVTNTHEHYITASNFVVDSPNTTSAVTYTFAAVKGSGGTTSSRIMGGTSFPITMFAMEIGG